jgi:hypothetical protein
MMHLCLSHFVNILCIVGARLQSYVMGEKAYEEKEV